MARGHSLLSLLDDLRAAGRLSLNPAHNVQVRDAQIKHLQRAQEWLWEDFDWPHLVVQRRIALQAGQRYYDPPTDVPLDRIVKIRVRHNNLWLDLEPGIGPAQYAAYDSDLDSRSTPALRWALYEDEQIEIWPIPDVNADTTTLEGMIEVTGVRTLKPLVAEDDVCDLDSRLIVAFAAAEMLAAAKAADAQAKASFANRLYGKLKGDLMPRRKFKMFGKTDSRPLRRGPPSIYYRTES